MYRAEEARPKGPAPDNQTELNQMPGDLDDRTVHLRAWFGNLLVQAEQLLAQDLVPSWFKEMTSEGHFKSALRKAKLPVGAGAAVSALTLALVMAVDAVAPRPNAEVRRRIERVSKRATKLRHDLNEGRLE